MRNRFELPKMSEEGSANCANCGAERLASSLLFDENTEKYLCDRECFDVWHADNIEEVGDYYFRMNVDY